MKKLHTCLLACTGSCTHVLALRLIEDITEGETHTAVWLDFPLHGASTIIHGQVGAVALEQVIHKQLCDESTFAEAFVSRKAGYPTSLVEMSVTTMSLGLKRCVHTDVECLREAECVLPLERAKRTIELSLSVGSVGIIPIPDANVLQNLKTD